MLFSRRVDLCIECRKETGYYLKKTVIHKIIKDRPYVFEITTAVCKECGSPMSIPGLVDLNTKEIDEQYRAIEKIVSVEDIERLMKLYDIGKDPLSLALGFGQVTIGRYIKGQIPSKKHSDVIKKALTSPQFMKARLKENREKLTDAAYRKAMFSAESMEKLFSVSGKMLHTIAYLFSCLGEITPLALQKLLYFTQEIHYACNEKFIFDEDCQAWEHGPVYAEVYNLFKNFSFNPTDDARFAMFNPPDDALTDSEKRTLELVADTFGLYGGKYLEKITHNELPWMEAREGYANGVPSAEVIPRESIATYVKKIRSIYEVDTKDGWMRYIRDIADRRLMCR